MSITKKDFSTGYPFQDLEMFYDFLKNKESFNIVKKDENKAFLLNMRLLLIVSTFTGIKVSQLIQLLWSDVITLNGENYPTPKKRLIFKRFDIPIIEKLQKEFVYHHRASSRPRINDYIFTDDGEPWNPRNLARDIRTALEDRGFYYANEFKTESPQIMFGRTVILVHGYNKRVIQELKKHLNFSSESKLMEFLFIDSEQEKRRMKYFDNLLSGL